MLRKFVPKAPVSSLSSAQQYSPLPLSGRAIGLRWTIAAVAPPIHPDAYCCEGAAMESGLGKLEEFMRQASFRSLFSIGRKGKGEDDDAARSPIPQLSHIANSVVARCSRIICIPTDDLQQQYDKEFAGNLKQPSTYARNLLEYCCYQALHILTKRPNYLSDKEFRRLSYDMMLAWEAPSADDESISKQNSCASSPKMDDEDDGSFFYTNSINMAIQVDCNKTIGAEAFARIAHACPTVADTITVQNLFDSLTDSSGGQLHFLIYDKYIGSLDKVFKNVRSHSASSINSGLHLAEGEIILDIDGTLPTQPVLQHIGISAWPGRLTLTNRALYFESLGVGSYDKAVVYDLAADLKQIIKPDLTGPLGARIFDKAVMYKSIIVEEPVCFEFPELKGHSRRDYWLAVIREVAYVNKFIRKYNLPDIQQAEALSKAIIGITQYRAVKEAFHVMPSHFKTLLSFNLAEELPMGDEILEALYEHLKTLIVCSDSQNKHDASVETKILPSPVPVSLLSLRSLGVSFFKDTNGMKERTISITASSVGVVSPLEIAVKQSLSYSLPAEAARATVEQVKVEGLDTNLAVMKELLFPVVESYKRLHFLATWEDPFKSTIFLALILYVVHGGWARYILPFMFTILAVFMLWQKHQSKGTSLEAFRITLPPSRNPVEQLLTLQEAISQIETYLQAGNIIILKIRAILFAAMPKVTERVAISLIATAVLLAVVPFRNFVMLAFFEAFTREMPLRKSIAEKFVRRMREWWVHIPAAPVKLIRLEDSRKRR